MEGPWLIRSAGLNGTSHSPDQRRSADDDGSTPAARTVCVSLRPPCFGRRCRVSARFPSACGREETPDCLPCFTEFTSFSSVRPSGRLSGASVSRFAGDASKRVGCSDDRGNRREESRGGACRWRLRTRRSPSSRRGADRTVPGPIIRLHARCMPFERPATGSAAVRRGGHTRSRNGTYGGAGNCDDR